MQKRRNKLFITRIFNFKKKYFIYKKKIFLIFYLYETSQEEIVGRARL